MIIYNITELPNHISLSWFNHDMDKIINSVVFLVQFKEYDKFNDLLKSHIRLNCHRNRSDWMNLHNCLYYFEFLPLYDISQIRNAICYTEILPLLCSNSEYYRFWRYDHLWTRELNYRLVFELRNEQLLSPIYHLTYWWDLCSVQLISYYFIFPRVSLYKALCISSLIILILYEYST